MTDRINLFNECVETTVENNLSELADGVALFMAVANEEGSISGEQLLCLLTSCVAYGRMLEREDIHTDTVVSSLFTNWQMPELDDDNDA